MLLGWILEIPHDAATLQRLQGKALRQRAAVGLVVVPVSLAVHPLTGRG